MVFNIESKTNVFQEDFNELNYGIIKDNIDEVFRRINAQAEYNLYVVFFNDGFLFNEKSLEYDWLDIYPKTKLDTEKIRKRFNAALKKVKAVKPEQIINYILNYRGEPITIIGGNLVLKGYQDIIKDETSREFFDTEKNEIIISGVLSHKSKISQADHSARRPSQTFVIIIEIDKRDYKRFANVPNAEIEFALRDDEVTSKQKNKSFFDYVIAEVFGKYSNGVHGQEAINYLFSNKNFYKPNNTHLSKEIDLLISNAGNNFINFVICDVAFGKNYTDDYNKKVELVNNIETISALAYEKQDALGGILMCDPRFIDVIEMTIAFEQTIDFGNHKLVRKLLQIVSNDLILVASYNYIYGIITRKMISELRKETNNLFMLSIKKSRVWDIVHLDEGGDKLMILSEYNRFKYPSNILMPDILRKSLEITLGSDEKTTNKLIRIAECAAQQKHGTILVFSKQAKEEAARLKRTGILIRPTDLSLNIDITQMISSIDGAVLCDEYGVCCALGVILDGTSGSENEDISRGARHNSAHRYYNSHKGECVLIIVSEDGDIGVIPQI